MPPALTSLFEDMFTQPGKMENAIHGSAGPRHLMYHWDLQPPLPLCFVATVFFPFLYFLFQTVCGAGLNEDFVERIATSAANVLSFQYYNGVDVTILVSKNAGRYRIQAGCLEVCGFDLWQRDMQHFTLPLLPLWPP